MKYLLDTNMLSQGQLQTIWTPVFTGVTTFYEFIKFDGVVKSQIFAIASESQNGKLPYGRIPSGGTAGSFNHRHK